MTQSQDREERALELEDLLLRIRENARKQGTLLSQVLAPPKDVGGSLPYDLHTLQARTNIYEIELASHRRLIGQPLGLLRRLLRKLMLPILKAQVEYNAANSRVVSQLNRRIDQVSDQQLRQREELLNLQAEAYEAFRSVLGALDQTSLVRTPFRTLAERLDERWVPTVTPDLAAVIPERALWVGPNDTLAHFLRWPVEYRVLLALLAGLTPHSAVLEIGCNHGRTALGLLQYLQPPGRYEGLDILTPQVDFASSHITPRYPHFRFQVADVFNGIYNPTGTTPADVYEFPFPDASFDVVYAASVFTHLLPADAANYLRQSCKKLRPGGRCLFSFFVLDHFRGPGTVTTPLYDVRHQLPGHEGVAVSNPEVPEAVIAYSRARIEALAGQAGLRVVQVLPGYWAGGDGLSVNEQDLVLFERIA